MFSSRVLPRPVPFAEESQVLLSSVMTGAEHSLHLSVAFPGEASHLHPPSLYRPDALRQNRIIMPGEREQTTFAAPPSVTSFTNDRLRTPSPDREPHVNDERLSPDSIDDKESVGTEASLASNLPPVASGSRTKKKRRLSQANETSTSVGKPPAIAAAPAQQKDRITSTILRGIDSPSQICLCQPDPKVPRPRNAFILYRQHHQAKVVNENPGLANPEISKIIGDQWRNSALEVKAHWKSLAEEEKLRHQRQYPDYRYQPKRGRNSVAAAATLQPGQASPRCPKCGGRSMATPTHMASPGFRPTAAPQPESPVHHRHPQSQAYAHAANGHGYAQTHGHTPYPPQSAGMHPGPRTPYGIPGPYMSMSPIHPSFAQRPAPHGFRELDRITPAEYPLSPDAKRRRYDSGPPSAYPPNSAQHQRKINSPPPPPLPQSHHQHHHSLGGSERLPRPEFMQKPSPGFTIAPAPQGARNASAVDTPGGPRTARPDSSLTLPPIKIKTDSPVSHNHPAIASSIPAMLLSIRPIQKLLTLARISQPLQNPGPTSPPHPVRGALISIEFGDDRTAGEAIANAIRDELVRNNEHVTRAFEPPKMELYGREARNSDVLKLMDCWHGVSEEIRKWITTVPEIEAAKGSSDPAVKVREGGFAGAGRGMRSESPVSPRTVPALPRKRKADGNDDGDDDNNDRPPAGDPSAPLAAEIEALTRAASTPDPHGPQPVPVAFVPNYQLTATDAAAIAVPIADEYSPLDHWRWVAALWRGTVGPDVIVCVRGPEEADGVSSPDGAGGGGKKQSVEVRLEDARTVLVRLERSGEVGEGALRRVAFEVGEWVRGRGEREGR